MRALLETLDTWRAAGADVGRAVVVRTFGSAPRPEGAVLIVADDGRLLGSVSGGGVGSGEGGGDAGLAGGGPIYVPVQPALPAAITGRAGGSLGPRGRSVAVATPLP